MAVKGYVLDSELCAARSARVISGVGQLLAKSDVPTDKPLIKTSITGYELGRRDPPLMILLGYAEVAGICVDVLINDKLDLPTKLPSKAKHSHH